MRIALPSRIKFANARKYILVFLAIFAMLAVYFAKESPQKSIGAGISINLSTNPITVTFGSGYYTVDGNGKVYTKTGEIADVPDDMYPYVSYLSEPYPDLATQLSIQSKNVIVDNGATVLMEGDQDLNYLEVNTGGLITQPQPDRSGKINRYMYSDQEWGAIFYGYLKVEPGILPADQRKLVCPDAYYTNPTTTEGNGCVTSFSTTLGTNISALNDWQNFDQIWQTGDAAFTASRYSGGPAITNSTGSTQYYPVRIKFKNDNRDDRNEPMRAILRDGAEALVGSPNGVDMNNIYGVDPATGLVDAVTGQARMMMNYGLLKQYVATPAAPTLGWIAEDFSNAYGTYTTYMNDTGINFTNFFDGYGEQTNGLFDLQFDDHISYSAAEASSPFALGTTGAVYDQEAYKNYAFSAKIVNPNIGDSPRYVNTGLKLSVTTEVRMSGGNIDVSGKGYPGYSMELRTENDGVFMNTRGGGYGSAGGLSLNEVPQSAAHAIPNGAGGAGRSSGTRSDRNTNTYGSVSSSTNLEALGSGAGSSSNGNFLPTHGGDGGGYININADTLRFDTTTGGVKANGTNGYQITSTGWNGSGGGSGGTVAISALNLYYPETTTATSYFEATGGVGFSTATQAVPEGGWNVIGAGDPSYNGVYLPAGTCPVLAPPGVYQDEPIYIYNNPPNSRVIYMHNYTLYPGYIYWAMDVWHGACDQLDMMATAYKATDNKPALPVTWMSDENPGATDPAPTMNTVLSIPMSSGGGGGYVRVNVSKFYWNGVNTNSKNKINSSIRVNGGVGIVGDGANDYIGGQGKRLVIIADPANITFPEVVNKNFPITRYLDASGDVSGAKDYQFFPDDSGYVNLKVKGLADPTVYEPSNVDIVLVSDTTESMSALVNVNGVVKSKLEWLQEAANKLLQSAATNNADDIPDQIRLGLVNFNSPDYPITPTHPFGGCEANQNNPYGKACSFSYDGNYMSGDPAVFTGALTEHVDSYNHMGGTSAGAGLNNAIDHLLNISEPNGARTNSRKFIIFITDGEENLPTCISAATDPSAYGLDGACTNSIAKFTDPLNGPPDTNYPLFRLKDKGIGLITIGTTVEDDYGRYLEKISEYARPSDFLLTTNPDNKVFYGVNDISLLNDAFQSTLYSIIASQPKGMAFKVNDLLPPGVKADMSNITINGSPKVCSKSTGADNREKIECQIESSDYSSATDFGDQEFTISIPIESGDVESGKFLDLDQNLNCIDENAPPNDPAYQLFSGLPNSFIEYNPEGPYVGQGTNLDIKQTPTICRQFFSNSIKGDVFSTTSSSDYLKNFAFYGLNLNQSNTGSLYGAGYAWGTAGYELNQDAQASYSAGQKDYYDRRISLLAGEAESIPASTLRDTPNWYLQGENINQASASEEKLYPEGKIWKVEGDLNLTQTISYRGRGTIIVSGNMIINSGVNVLPNSSSDFLGIIVRGLAAPSPGLTFSGSNEVQFANFTASNIWLNNSNIMATGSFVANSFVFGSNAKSRIRFYYDYRLGSVWPPGFRFFNMPVAGER